MGWHHTFHRGLKQHKIAKKEELAVFVEQDIDILLPSDISAPGSWVFGPRLNYTTGFPGPTACSWQRVELPGHHNYVNQFL